MLKPFVFVPRCLHKLLIQGKILPLEYFFKKGFKQFFSGSFTIYFSFNDNNDKQTVPQQNCMYFIDMLVFPHARKRRLYMYNICWNFWLVKYNKYRNNKITHTSKICMIFFFNHVLYCLRMFPPQKLQKLVSQRITSMFILYYKLQTIKLSKQYKQ